MIVYANSKFVNHEYCWINVMSLNEFNFYLFQPLYEIGIHIYYDLTKLQSTKSENVNFLDIYHENCYEKNKFTTVQYGFDLVFKLQK